MLKSVQKTCKTSTNIQRHLDSGLFQSNFASALNYDLFIGLLFQKQLYSHKHYIRQNIYSDMVHQNIQ